MHEFSRPNLSGGLKSHLIWFLFCIASYFFSLIAFVFTLNNFERCVFFSLLQTKHFKALAKSISWEIYHHNEWPECMCVTRNFFRIYRWKRMFNLRSSLLWDDKSAWRGVHMYLEAIHLIKNECTIVVLDEPKDKMKKVHVQNAHKHIHKSSESFGRHKTKLGY